MFRKMRRFKQQLTDDACAQVLETAPRGVLAVSGDDDYPYTVPLNFIFDPQRNRLYFHCAKEGHKLDAIARNDKASFNVMSACMRRENEWWCEFDSVTVFGRMRTVTDEHDRMRALYDLARKYFPDEETVEREVQKDGARALILELVPEHITGKHVREK